MTRLPVLLVDDDVLMRAGIQSILSTDDQLTVVGEAANGREAIALAQRFAPRVVLMDVRMPDMDGIAATREIVRLVPDARVLMLTTFSDDEYVLGAIRAGASGFLLKRSQPEDLIAAIHTIAGGESLLSPSVTNTVIDRLAREPAPDPSAGRRLRQLTPRERDVLLLISRGLNNAEIAASLQVEESTVKTHVKRILSKLDLRDRVQAVIFVYESGMVRAGGVASTVTGPAKGPAS